MELCKKDRHKNCRKRIVIDRGKIKTIQKKAKKKPNKQVSTNILSYFII